MKWLRAALRWWRERKAWAAFQKETGPTHKDDDLGFAEALGLIPEKKQ